MTETAGRLILVSHQLPFKVQATEDSWQLTNRQGHAALYAGIEALHGSHEVVHVGWTVGSFHLKLLIALIYDLL